MTIRTRLIRFAAASCIAASSAVMLFAPRTVSAAGAPEPVCVASNEFEACHELNEEFLSPGYYCFQPELGNCETCYYSPEQSCGSYTDWAPLAAR